MLFHDGNWLKRNAQMLLLLIKCQLCSKQLRFCTAWGLRNLEFIEIEDLCSIFNTLDSTGINHKIETAMIIL